MNNNVILVIIISIIIFLIFLFIKNQKKCHNDIKLCQLALKQYMKDFHKSCEENNILYWADSGTLLGAVREKGMIPHDDDIDICLYEEDLIRLLKIYENDPIYHIVPNNIEKGIINKLKRRDIDCIFIDLFIVENMYINNEKIVRYKYKVHQKLWPNFYYIENEIFPIIKIPFEDFEICIPNNPIPYLERGYGNWRVPIVYGRH